MLSRCLLLAALTTPLFADDADLPAARALMHEHRYQEARDALERLSSAQPDNAEVWHELGLAWKTRHDTAAYEAAVRCLTRASELAPRNPEYLADRGATSLELAGRTRSLTLATQGRDLLIRALAMKPDMLDAREGLFQFYTQAPFFVGGSAGKAAAQIEEIRKLDPDRAIALEVLAKANAKQYADAFKLCESALARHGDNYTALYQYGRTASVSGQNLELGLERLRKCLTLEPPSPASPTHSHAWYRIGDLELKLGHPAEARKAFETALQLDAGNGPAANALKKLGPP